jgi:hypothetical protein
VSSGAGGRFAIFVMHILIRTLGAVLIAAVSAIATLWMSGRTLVGPHRPLAPTKFEVTYMDFVTVLLTVLTIVLAALAIGIGLVAFRTIKEIKEDARKIATEQATATMTELTKGLPGQVEIAVDKFVHETLPAAIKQNVVVSIEQYARSGELGKLLERAYFQMSALDPQTAREFADESDQTEKDADNGKP